MRFRCRWVKHMTAPTTAVSDPAKSSTIVTASATSSSAPEKTVQYDAHERVQTQLAHRRREQEAHGRGGDGVRVGEPEVERHDRAPWSKKPTVISVNAPIDEAVGFLAGERLSDLRHVQRARARVDQRDAREDQERADAVRHGEVQRAGERSLLLDVVGGQRVGRDAHELEEDEQVEQVAGQREPHRAREEQEHQRVEQRPDDAEVAEREDERHHEHGRDERRQPGPDRIDRERDARAPRARAAPSRRTSRRSCRRPTGTSSTAQITVTATATNSDSTSTNSRLEIATAPTSPAAAISGITTGSGARSFTALTRALRGSRRDPASRSACAPAPRSRAASPSPSCRPRRR